MRTINNHILHLKDVRYFNRLFHVAEDDLNYGLNEFVDNYAQTSDHTIRAAPCDEVWENVLVVPLLHLCFCHALIDHIFPYFWALRDIRRYNNDFGSFKLLVVTRGIWEYWESSTRIVGKVDSQYPFYVGIWAELISILEPEEVIFEHALSNFPNIQILNAYFYKRG